MTTTENIFARFIKSPWVLLLSGVAVPLFLTWNVGFFLYQYWSELSVGQTSQLVVLITLSCLTPLWSLRLVVTGLKQKKLLEAKSVTLPIIFSVITFVWATFSFGIFSDQTFTSPFLFRSPFFACSSIILHFIFILVSFPENQRIFGLNWGLIPSLARAALILVAILLIPAFFYLADKFDITLPRLFSPFISTAFFLCCITLGLLFFFCLLRILILTANICLKKQRKSPLLDIFIRILVVWILPFSGLALNRIIPFPMPCASPWYLILTFLTGLALLFPLTASENRIARWVSWCLRWLFFPFTLYFFFLFLPWMPIGIFALLVVGTGFLVFAPTFLMVLHCNTLREDARWLRQTTSCRNLILAAVIAFAVIPGVLTGRAILHRQVLHTLLETVFNSPSGEMNRPLPVSQKVAQHVLEEAYDFKNGVSVPILSSFYRMIVFDGLMLPDERLDRLWSIVSAESKPTQKPILFGEFAFMGQDNSYKTNRRWMQKAPTKGVVAHEAEITREPGETDDLLTLHLTVRNTNGYNEWLPYGYAGTLYLPPAAFITGISLKIEDEWVPGRLFERTAAEWVYARLTEQRIDPALLTAKPEPGEYTLQVYPVETTRDVRITWVVPHGYSESVRIDDLTAGGEPPLETPFFYVAPGVLATSSAWVTTQKEMAPDASVLRSIIIDAGGSGLPVTDAAITQKLTKNLPCLAIEAGLGIRAAFLDSEEAMRAFQQSPDAVPRVGGSDLSAAFRLTVHQARDRGCTYTIDTVSKDPGFSKRLESTLNQSANRRFGSMAADASTEKGYVIAGESLKRFIPADTPTLLLWPGDIALDTAPLPGERITLPAESRWAKAAAIWQMSREQWERPADKSLRNTLIAAARAGSVMIPQNSWIVVERRSDWIELEKQEQTMLQAGTAFSIQGDAPETLLVAGLFLILGWQRLRKRRRSRSQS